MKLDRGLWMFGSLSLVLALVPFYPEPHLFGKIKWLIGGGTGMESVDWLDLILHGGPIISFLFILGFVLGRQARSGS